MKKMKVKLVTKNIGYVCTFVILIFFTFKILMPLPDYRKRELHFLAPAH